MPYNCSYAEPNIEDVVNSWCRTDCLQQQQQHALCRHKMYFFPGIVTAFVCKWGGWGICIFLLVSDEKVLFIICQIIYTQWMGLLSMENQPQ